MKDDYALTAAFLNAAHNLRHAVYREYRTLTVRFERGLYGEVAAALVRANWRDESQSRSLSCEWRCRRSEDLRVAIGAALSAIEAAPYDYWVDAAVNAYAALHGEVR